MKMFENIVNVVLPGTLLFAVENHELNRRRGLLVTTGPDSILELLEQILTLPTNARIA